MRFIRTISCLLLSTACATSALASVNGQDAIDAHNKWRNALNRGEVGSQPVPNPYLADMYWDTSLEATAQQHSDQCVWQHSNTGGENLYAHTGSSGSITAGVDLWAGEHESYDYSSNSSTDNGMIGHYTQLVWHDSVRVGCAKTVCDPLKYPDGSAIWNQSATLYTCQYRESGNWVGQKPYTTSAAPTTTVHYNSNNGDISVPLLRVGSQFYRVKMKLTGYDPIVVETAAYEELQGISVNQYPSVSDFDGQFLTFQNLVVDDGMGYYLKLKHLGDLTFEVVDAQPLH